MRGIAGGKNFSLILSMIGRECRLGFLIITVWALRSTWEVTLAWPNSRSAGAISRQIAHSDDGVPARNRIVESVHCPAHTLQDTFKTKIGRGDDVAVTVRHRPFDDAGEHGEHHLIEAPSPLRLKRGVEVEA